MGTSVHWLLFNLFVIVAVTMDLAVFHRRPHRIAAKEAVIWTLIWVTLTVVFGLSVLRYAGRQPALEFFTGYLIEKALSVDNLFLFLVIFRAFRVQENIQHRVLEWGILGALLMRGLMIAAGAALIERFSWVLYLFGGFLVYAGLHMLFVKKEKVHPERGFVSRFASRHLRVLPDYREHHFFSREAGKWFATPLFLVLLVVEITDITLAVDSIPAIFGITRDPFIVYTSNVFAILGLRAMYFLLAGMLSRFRYLTVGLAFVLVFIGGKMIAEPWIHIPVQIALSVVAGMLLVALVISLVSAPKPEK